MNYYINPIWFYLIDVCSSLRGVFSGAILLSVLGFFGFTIAYLIPIGEGTYDMSDEEDVKLLKSVKRGMRITLILSIISSILVVATPSGDGVTKMMIASVITEENVESTKEDVKEIVDYITEKIIETKGKGEDN